MTRKNFVIDTSVLVYHEDSIHAFPDSNLFIPMTVLEELDGLKVRNDSVGNAARYINRFLDNLREQGSLIKGVKLENNQKVFVVAETDLSVLPESMGTSNDNKIIATAKKLSEKKRNVIVLSRDIAFRVKCDSIGLKAENYSKDKAKTNRKGAFTGVSVLDFFPEDISEFYSEGSVETQFELEPNEFVVLKGGESSALGIYKEGKVRKLNFANKKGFNVQGIKPRNKEQNFAAEMLLDPSIHMVTISGMAGSGKTLIATACAFEMLFKDQYQKIVLSRPVKSMSADIGYLPGDKNEKMQSWVQPFYDNMRIIFGDKGMKFIEAMQEKGKIEVEALTYIRGRTLPDTIFIIDEAQNITYHEAKAVLTRMGENSKIILLGDLEQIDAPHLDSSNSGLAAVVELFKDFNLSGHITLLKGERSPLAAHAAKIL